MPHREQEQPVAAANDGTSAEHAAPPRPKRARKIGIGGMPRKMLLFMAAAAGFACATLAGAGLSQRHLAGLWLWCAAAAIQVCICAFFLYLCLTDARFVQAAWVRAISPMTLVSN